MRFKKVKEIFRKEVLDTLRDRRTILMMIVVPVLLYPGLLILITEMTAAQQAKLEQRTVTIALSGLPQDSPLIERLRKTERVIIVQSRDPFKDVQEGKVLFVIDMPPGSERRIQEKGTAEIKLRYDRSNDDATINVDRIRKVIEEYGKNILDQRLREKQLNKEYVQPINIEEVNVASKQKMGGFVIGRFLPMMLVIMVLMGALYPAIDMTAGEKERGTLETILTSPATRSEIIAGKFLTVTLIALVTGLLNIGSMAGTFIFGVFKQVSESLQFNIPAHYILIMMLCLIPLAVFFSGMMIAVSSFARSFKDASSLLTPVYIVASVPAFISTVPGIQLEGFWVTVPIANVVLLYKELMIGVFRLDHIIAVFLCTAFFAGAALFAAVKLFGREEVLFGEASSLGLSFRRSNFPSRNVPEPSESMFYVMLAMICLLYIAIPLQARNLPIGLIVTEVGFFLALPVGLAHYLKLNLKTTFSLRAPTPSSLIAALLFALGVLLAAGTIMYVQNQFLPMPQKALEALEKMMKATQQYPLPLILLLVAVMPAICEEMAFRGFILSGLSSKFKPFAAMAATAAFFAAFHLSLYRFLPTFLIGLAACYLVWRSRSIVAGMILHMVNNATITILSNYPQLDTFGVSQMKPSLPLFIAGIASVAAAVFLLRHFKPIAEVPRSGGAEGVKTSSG
jgi:sodium transport system permease protein